MMAGAAPDPAVARGTLASVSLPLRHRMRVRYSECDLQGAVSSAHYHPYADDGMTEPWRAADD